MDTQIPEFKLFATRQPRIPGRYAVRVVICSCGTRVKVTKDGNLLRHFPKSGEKVACPLSWKKINVIG